MSDTMGLTLPSANFKTYQDHYQRIHQYVGIKYFYDATLKTNGLKRLPYSLQDDVDNTVAHELAHGIGVPHHGSSGKV